MIINFSAVANLEQINQPNNPQAWCDTLLDVEYTVQ